MQLWAWGMCCWDGTVIFQTNGNSSLVALEFYCCLRRWPLEANPLNNARRCLCPRIVRRCGAALTLGLQVLLSGILRIYARPPASILWRRLLFGVGGAPSATMSRHFEDTCPQDRTLDATQG